MLKRAWVLIGTTLFSLFVLFALLRLIPMALPAAHAQAVCITIDRDITSDTIWTEACYRVTTNTVTIHHNVALTISPPSFGGTRVEFESGAQLQVLGTLYALGTSSQSITFTSVDTTAPARCDWIGIIIESDSGGDIIQNSVIEYACTGVKVNDEDGIFILSNVFRFNGNSDSTSGAIGGDVDYSLIADNQIHDCTNGIALGEAGSNTFVNNTIYDIDGYGVFLMRGGVGGGSDNDIVDNVISTCTNGGLRLEDGFSNRIFGNLIFLNPGGGIYLDEQSVDSVRDNHLYFNGGGSNYQAAIYITNTTFLSDVVGNVVYDEFDDAIQYDASNIGGPVMVQNALCSIPSFELRNDDIATIDGRSNWWSTNTPMIGVNYLGPVNITPWITLSLEGAATGVITVRLRDPNGNTVPPPPSQVTSPPAPNARRVDLSSNWGTPNPPFVVVNDQGIGTATLIPSAAPAPQPIVITATGFCYYVVTDTVEFPNLAITKSTAATQVVAGDVLDYQISYANTGNVAATDVYITETLPSGTVWNSDTAEAVGWTRIRTTPDVAWYMPTLPAGASGSFMLSLSVASTACGTSLTNLAEIGTTGIETDLSDNTSSAGPIPVVCADLAITKTADITWVIPGGQVTYTVDYRNNGGAGAQSVVLTDTWLLPGTSWSSDTAGAAGWTRMMTTPQVVWTMPTLSAGASGSFQVVLQVSATVACGARLTNTVDIATTTPESDYTNNQDSDNSVTVICRDLTDITVVKDDDVGPITTPRPSLSAAKQSAVNELLEPDRAPLAITQHREFVYEGDVVTYTIAVVNTSLYTATNVVLTETLPEYTTYLGIGWTQVNSRTFTQTVGTLAPGEGQIYYFVVQVDDLLPPGVSNLVNLVCAWPDETDLNPDDNCNYEDTPVRRRPMRLIKSAPDCISPGDLFDYTITYWNVMTDTTFYNVGLTDTLDAYVSFAGGPTDGWTCIGQICNYSIPEVPPSTTGTVRLRVRLSSTFPYTIRTVITNVVEISGGFRFILVTPIYTGADLAVVKNDNVGPVPFAQQERWDEMSRRISSLRPSSPLQTTQHREFVRPGEFITYTILFLNSGVGTATGVVLTETLPEYTSYAGGGWTHVGGRQYVLNIGTLGPRQGGEAYFIVQVNDPFPPAVDRVINRVDIGGGVPECDLSNNWSADDTPVRAGWNLYVANWDSGTVDVFNTTDYSLVTTIPVGRNPFGMAAHDHYLYVADFDETATLGRLQIVDTLLNTVVYSVTVGSHPIHIATDGDYVYVPSHSSPPAITVLRTEPPWDVTTLTLDRHLTYEFGFFGAVYDAMRDIVYFTKRDFGSIGLWTLTPPDRGSQLDFVYPTNEANREKPSSMVYHATTDRVYVTFGLRDELWVFDPNTWQRLETIPTGVQDPIDPGYGGHGLAASGQCVFVSNYQAQSVTAVVDGSCVDNISPRLADVPSRTYYQVYLPLVRGHSGGANLPMAQSQNITTIPLSGRPKGMATAGDLLFVTLPEQDRVAIISLETLAFANYMVGSGGHPHTILVVSGN